MQYSLSKIFAIGSPDNEKKYAGFCTAVFT